MKIKQAESAMESILFASGGPVTIERLMSVLQMRRDDVRTIMGALQRKYEDEKRGIRIHELEGAYQMCAAEENADYVSTALQRKKKPVLSKAALEVLSIVAYRQPVTRSYVEQVRGVESSSIVNTLLEKGYLEEQGRLDAPGRPVLFGTSREFLRVFGLRSISDLPRLPGMEDEQPHLEQIEKPPKGESHPDTENQ